MPSKTQVQMEVEERGTPVQNDNSMVLDLQRDAMDRNCPVSSLLRSSLVVAKKLGLEDFRDWISSELNGYESDPPDYRKVQGVAQGWNPVRGWVPVVCGESDIAEAISHSMVHQPIAELEHLARGDESSSALMIPYGGSRQEALARATRFQTQFGLFVGKATVSGILDAVRTTILSWTLRLEDEGVIGRGLSFNAGARERAQSLSEGVQINSEHIEHLHLAQSGSSIHLTANLHLKIEHVETFLGELSEKVRELDLARELHEELDADIATIEAQAKSPRPNARIVRESLSSIKRVLEGASGAAGVELLKSLGQLLL